MLESLDVQTLFNAFAPAAPYAIGGISGFVVGKLLKFVFKVAAIITGAIIIFLGALSYFGMITVNFAKVEATIVNGSKVAADQTYDILQHINENIQQNSNEVMIGGSISFLGGVALALKT
jgi:uncharacterized membrane protein (Fun14 family)